MGFTPGVWRSRTASIRGVDGLKGSRQLRIVSRILEPGIRQIPTQTLEPGTLDTPIR